MAAFDGDDGMMMILVTERHQWIGGVIPVLKTLRRSSVCISDNKNAVSMISSQPPLMLCCEHCNVTYLLSCWFCSSFYSSRVMTDKIYIRNGL